MIREHEVPAWHRFCIKVALLLAVVVVISSHSGVTNEQKQHSFTGYRAGH